MNQWDRVPGESSVAFEAFVHYRDFSPSERSISAVAQKLNKNMTTLGNWSGQWSWVARAAAWDDHLAKVSAEATADYQFKLLEADPNALKSIDLDKPMSHEEAINVYRAITRACRKGVADWMNGKDLPNPITARQIMGLTDGAFGGQEFAKFFVQEATQ